LGLFFPILVYGKIKNVPNPQPELIVPETLMSPSEEDNNNQHRYII
jgi:hypothetical protein